MTQFIPQQKTIPERMASIETLLYGFIGDFRRYQDSLDENFKAIREGQAELKANMDMHVTSDDKKKIKTWDALKWEILKWAVIVILSGLAGAAWEFYTG